jgi:hypothetical protein
MDELGEKNSPNFLISSCVCEWFRRYGQVLWPFSRSAANTKHRTYPGGSFSTSDIPFASYPAYALPPLDREERAARAKVVISTHFNSKQQVFLDFVLAHYVSVGVEELDQEKLTPLLRLKYHNSISDAVADLGPAEDIGQVFIGFQKYLYQHQAGA